MSAAVIDTLADLLQSKEFHRFPSLTGRSRWMVFVLYSPGRCRDILLGATLRAIGFHAGAAGAEDPIGAYRFD